MDAAAKIAAAAEHAAQNAATKVQVEKMLAARQRLGHQIRLVRPSHIRCQNRWGNKTIVHSNRDHASFERI